jgi:peptidoglycan hydrolase-like amidase
VAINRRSTRRSFCASLLGFPLLAWGKTYSFHVLGLLHSQALTIAAVPPGRVLLTTCRTTITLEASQTFVITAADTPATLCGTEGGAASFVLHIPRVIRRAYFGILSISAQGQTLLPIVHMDTETAVSSIVGAELPVSGTSLQAMAAQAVVARSFLIAAGRRHTAWDFCDTTHCQFLRAPAPPGTIAEKATRVTAGLTLKSGGQTIACRYSAACGGHTDQREELGYLYQSVSCEVCQVHHYVRRGHGLGLCQQGAIDLAGRGWQYDRILAKYFPATHL